MAMNLKGRTLGTRERLIMLLRDKSKTVDELAGELAITLNAVRSQLTILERDGIVHMVGERRGARRPSIIYGLTGEGEQLLSRAYGPFLKAILRAVSQKSRSEQAESIMRDAGRMLADEIGRPAGDFPTRLAKVLALVEELGGSMEAVESDGKWILRGRGCPLAEAVAVEPLTCKCMETLLSELTGAEAVERCKRGEQKRCEFLIKPHRKKD